MNLFLDSSALTKRYVHEPGGNRLDDLLAEAESLGLCVICVTEIVSALCRRRREKALTPKQYQSAKLALFADVEDAYVVNLTEEVMSRAVAILEQSPVRAADALHVAAAAEWGADMFVSADEKQCEAARRYGLDVELLK